MFQLIILNQIPPNLISQKKDESHFTPIRPPLKVAPTVRNGITLLELAVASQAKELFSHSGGRADGTLVQ